MKFLCKDNFQLLVRILQHHKELTSKDQSILYHIMKFVNNQDLTLQEKNKTTIKLFYSQKHQENPLEHLKLPDEITKSYFVPLNQQRNIQDIQIDNDTSTAEFKKVYDDSLNFMDQLRQLPIDNRNKDIIIPETLEIYQLKQSLYNSIHDTIFLSIDSRDRDYKDPVYKMHIDLNKTIKQIYSIELIQLDIPKIQYLVNDDNNILHFQETNEITLEATITRGNYTISELISEIQTQLNSIGASTYTVSLVNDRVKIISDLTGGGNIFNLIFNGGTENYGFKTRSLYKEQSIGDILGFTNTDKTGASNYTASEIYKLDGEHSVYIHFSNIDCQKRYDRGAFAVIPLEVDHGQTVFFNQEYKIKHVFSPMIEIHHLNIELRNYSGHFYKTGEWSFLLKINYLK